MILICDARPAHPKALNRCVQMSFAATSPEGALDLKKQVEEAIAFPLSLGKSYGQGLTLTGPVEVSQKGDYYEVKLPGAVVIAMQGFKLDVGTILVNVTPGNDGELIASLSLPSTIRATDASGSLVTELKIGGQHFKGTWWPALAAFTSLDAEYKDVSFKAMPEGSFTGSMASVKAYANLTKNSDDTWSGPYGMAGSEIKVKVGGAINLDATLAGFKADSSYDKINLKSRKTMQDNFSQSLEKTLASGQPTPEQAGQMVQKMLDSMSGFIDGMGSNVELTGLVLDSKADPAATPPGMAFRASIDKVGMAFDVRGMLQPTGSTSFKLKLEGLNTGEVDPTITGMIPNNANFELYLENLPMQTLGNSLSNALNGLMGLMGGVGFGAVDPAKQQQIQDQAQMQMIQLMATVPQQLVSAGSQISIRNTFTDSPEFDTNLDGQFKASATSPVMADGKLTLSLKGVDELILKLQAMSQGANANPNLANYATMLSMLQVYTKPEAGSDGKSMRKLVFEVAPDGKLLLNGEPLQPMGMPPR